MTQPHPITVYYDAGCPFCRRCRSWIEGQPQLAPVRFVALSAPGARERFPGGRVPSDGSQLVVVDEATGAYWVGSRAFVVVLWALDGYRSIAMTLGEPLLLPFAEVFFDLVSAGRPLLSALFGGGDRCAAGHCGVSAPRGAYR